MGEKTKRGEERRKIVPCLSKRIIASFEDKMEYYI
jgi:hypothetical protein